LFAEYLLYFVFISIIAILSYTVFLRLMLMQHKRIKRQFDLLWRPILLASTMQLLQQLPKLKRTYHAHFLQLWNSVYEEVGEQARAR